MRNVLMLMLFAACGPLPEDGAPPPSWLETAGPTKPWLSINGDVASTDPAWLPTGVAFDERAQGWRISCLPGKDGRPRTLRFGPAAAGAALQLYCVAEEPGT